ncbi:diguanylate cyclase domain-containing protein [Catenovulum sp. SX2]|uniref:diguanylate cyclase domain-containing protein n=1 Tax=Catenovulum sp. SX2 TaxID=3398614 RepID=UPI003F85B6F2
MPNIANNITTANRDVEFLQRTISLILALTKQTDSLSLVDSLFLRLFKAKLVSYACMYEVHHKQGKEITQAGDAKQLYFKQVLEKPWQAKDTLEPPQIVIDSFLAQKPMTQAIEGKRSKYLVFPILPESGNVALALELQAIDVRAVQNFLAGNVLTVFTNLLKIFEKMERDPLTGLFNKQCLEVSLIRYAKLALVSAHDANRADKKEWLTFFKLENLNPAESDELQTIFGQVMLNTFRNSDLIFRYGEFEFIALLVCNEEAGVNSAVTRLADIMKTHSNEHIQQLKLTTGCALFADDTAVNEIVKKAKANLA